MAFANAEAYERLMGRWSQRLASPFLEFVTVNDGDTVLDIGCGTGSLAHAVASTRPHCKVTGIDPSATSIEYAKRRTGEERVRFDVGDAQQLPYPDALFDRTLALLVINFIPDARKAVSEMVRVTTPGGTVAAAVWDYGEGMTMLRTFWDAAVSLDGAAEPRHEKHMPFCRKGELASLSKESGLEGVEESGLTVALDFASFDDYFQPFMMGVGPSGSYATGLQQEQQNDLKERLRNELLGSGSDRSFTLEARAWAVRGTVPVR